MSHWGFFLPLRRNISCLDSRRLYCRTPETWFGGEFSAEWFGFRPESQRYRPKVGVTDRKSEIQSRIRTESPRKGPRMGFRCFYRKPTLKPSWIHLKHLVIALKSKKEEGQASNNATLPTQNYATDSPRIASCNRRLRSQWLPLRTCHIRPTEVTVASIELLLNSSLWSPFHLSLGLWEFFTFSWMV